MNKIITSAKIEDLEAINQLREVLLNDISQPHRLGALTSSELSKSLRFIVFLYKEASEVMGYISLAPEYDNAPENELCLNVFVHPDKRGSGLGTALIKKALESAQTLNKFSSITLAVKCTNTRALSLYEMFGFSVYNTTSNDILMRLSLENT